NRNRISITVLKDGSASLQIIPCETSISVSTIRRSLLRILPDNQAKPCNSQYPRSKNFRYCEDVKFSLMLCTIWSHWDTDYKLEDGERCQPSRCFFLLSVSRYRFPQHRRNPRRIKASGAQQHLRRRNGRRWASLRCTARSTSWAGSSSQAWVMC